MNRIAKIAGASAALVAAGLLVANWPLNQPAKITILPELVVVPAGQFDYRPAGEYRIGTRIVDPPLQTRTATTPLSIMKYPVDQAAYSRCVDDGACDVADKQVGDGLPQTDINYYDALDYAAWFSEQTKQNWRLPTDEEWVHAAAERAYDEALGDLDDASDPAKRWVLNYTKKSIDRGDADPMLRPRGSFGENANGVADLSGNVWEWTVTCYKNAQMDPDGATIIKASDYCGVRAVQGKHRAFIINFVRDAKVGGCAVGIPPDYLGFRLVRDPV